MRKIIANAPLFYSEVSLVDDRENPYLRNVFEQIKPNSAGEFIIQFHLPDSVSWIKTTRYKELWHSVARLVNAIKRFQLTHGAIPVRLDQLVPEYIDEVPLDPYDGRPLRYVPDKIVKFDYEAGGHNVNVYVGNSPPNFVDLLGAVQCDVEKTSLSFGGLPDPIKAFGVTFKVSDLYFNYEKKTCPKCCEDKSRVETVKWTLSTGGSASIEDYPLLTPGICKIQVKGKNLCGIFLSAKIFWDIYASFEKNPCNECKYGAGSVGGSGGMQGSIDIRLLQVTKNFKVGGSGSLTGTIKVEGNCDCENKCFVQMKACGSLDLSVYVYVYKIRRFYTKKWSDCTEPVTIYSFQ